MSNHVHLVAVPEPMAKLQAWTYAGRPFGEESFVKEMAEKFGRRWKSRQSKKESRINKERLGVSSEDPGPQFMLF